MAIKRLSKEELRSENEELRHENTQLKLQNNELLRLIQGVKSERFVSADPAINSTLFPNSQPKGVAKEREEKRRKKVPQHKRQPIPAQIPRQDRILEPEVDISKMTKIGEVVTEQYGIDIKLYVDRLIRPKYVDADSTIHIAPYDCLFAKSNIGESLASHVVVSKYIDHSPLYRQSKIYARKNVKLARSTLLDSVKRVAQKIKPVYQVAAKQILSADYLMADESSIPVLTKDNPGAARKGQMLVKVNPENGLVVFDYIKTKEKVNILEGLRGFKGFLQTDGNVSYNAKGAEKDVTHLNCLVHARRKFDAAKDFDEQRAGHVLKIIQEIYMLERQIKQNQIEHSMIRITRQQKTKPLLDQLHKYLLEQHRPDLTSNPFNRAVK